MCCLGKNACQNIWSIRINSLHIHILLSLPHISTQKTALCITKMNHCILLYFVQIVLITTLPKLWHKRQDTGERHKQASGPPPLPCSPSVTISTSPFPKHLSPLIRHLPTKPLTASYSILNHNLHFMLGHCVMPTVLTHHDTVPYDADVPFLWLHSVYV